MKNINKAFECRDSLQSRLRYKVVVFIIKKHLLRLLLSTIFFPFMTVKWQPRTTPKKTFFRVKKQQLYFQLLAPQKKLLRHKAARQRDFVDGITNHYFSGIVTVVACIVKVWYVTGNIYFVPQIRQVDVPGTNPTAGNMSPKTHFQKTSI